MEHSKQITAVVILLVVLAFSLRGCGRYSEVNELTYEHAKALFAACNSQKPERIEACSAMIAEAEATGRISGTEHRYLRSIIDTANDGNWEEAQTMVRQLMVDQTDL